MNDSMVIDTSASVSVTTTYVCLKCPLTIYGKSFVMDLVCLSLHQINVILGMKWLEFNQVHINCYNKTLRLPNFGDNGELMLLTTRQVNGLLDDEALMFTMFASLQVDGKDVNMDLPVVCKFPQRHFCMTSLIYILNVKWSFPQI